MEKPSYYSIIPASVRYDKNLCANAKLMYGEITALCNQEGYCWASNNYFAELYDIKRIATISEWIKALKDNGHIDVEFDGEHGEGRKIYLYNPLRKNVSPLTEKRNPPLTEKRNPPLTEKRKHNNKEINNKEDNINPLPLCINPTVWAEWVQHRKELKKSLTPTTIKKQLAQLEKWDKLGMDTSEIIHASITNGWLGLFPLRNGMRQTNGNGTKNAQTTAEAYEAMKQEQNAHNGFIDTEVYDG